MTRSWVRRYPAYGYLFVNFQEQKTYAGCNLSGSRIIKDTYSIQVITAKVVAAPTEKPDCNKRDIVGTAGVGAGMTTYADFLPVLPAGMRNRDLMGKRIRGFRFPVGGNRSRPERHSEPMTWVRPL